MKNHVNGLSYKDGKILAVPQGYIKDDKSAIDKYKKDYSDYWNKKLGGEGDMKLSEVFIPETEEEYED